jgi:hypothetical protein
MVVSRGILLFFAIVFLPLNLWADGDVYVSTTGNDTTGTGAIGAPLATIAHALEHITDANGGWNIILRDGMYNEHDINITASKTGTSGAWNTLRSYPGEWAIIDGERNCQTTMHPVIYNNGYYVTSGDPTDYAQYWKFERLGITGGGLSGGGNIPAFGIYWVHGPMTVRYCEIYDNLSDLHSECPAGIGGSCANDWTIEYNYVHGNGTTGSHGGNDRQIMTFTQEEGTYSALTSGDIANWGVKNNVIRYNLVDAEGQSQGISTKASNRLTPMSGGQRSTTDYTYRGSGDKIHHNIVTGAIFAGIFWQNDWVQIYNNIVDMQAASNYQGAITVRRTASEGVDCIHPCVYNNLTRGSYAGLYNDMDGKYFQVFQGLWANNIIDSPSEYGDDDYPITLYHRYGITWYSDREWPGDFTITGITVDRNYIYRGSQASGHDILFGKLAVTSGFDYSMSVAEFEAYNGSDHFIQATQESGSNKLFVNYAASTADKYRTITGHVMEGTDTIGASGIGGDHPYLSGATIPSYIGATNPSDDDWVAGVLGLATLSNLQGATAGSDPSWIEGSTPALQPTMQGCSLHGGATQQ